MSDEGSDSSEHEHDTNQIFCKPPSKPIPIHLHANLGLSVLTDLAKKISDHGGNPRANEDDAEVIVCRRVGPTFDVLTKRYDHHRDKWVEDPSWVRHCIKQNRYDHPKQPPTLKKTARGRTEYTPEDDNHIAEFLAKRIPFDKMKGRSGQSVWKDLCERTDLYPWADRHPWQSWRERYVKNTDVFDARIKVLVSREPNPPELGGKGQYRVVYAKSKPRNRPRFHDIECTVEEEGGENIDIEEGLLNNRKRRAIESAGPSSSKRHRAESSNNRRHVEAEEEEEEEDNTTNIRQAKSSQADLFKRIPEVVLQTKSPVSSPPALFFPDEDEGEHEATPRGHRNASPTVSETAQRLPSSLPPASAPKPRPKPVSKGKKSVNQALNREDDPPASRTRSRSREPDTVVDESFQTRRTRAGNAVPSSPPPRPPPPTLASQPRSIDLNQLQVRRRDPNRPVLKPSLIPIPELSELSQRRSGGGSRKNDLPAWETLQGEDESEPDKIGGDGGGDGDGDDDDDDESSSSSDSDFSDIAAMRQLNEGMRAFTEETMREFPNKNTGASTPSGFGMFIPKSRQMTGSESSDQNEDKPELEPESGNGDEEEEPGSSQSRFTGVESLNTQTSVPAVGTMARKYMVARKPFTPARGTLAQEHVSSDTTTRRVLRERKGPVNKGKGRAW